MRALAIVAALTFAIFTAPLPVNAQGPAITPRVGVLSVAASAGSPIAQTFRQALRDLGYTEGQNILIEWRYAGGRYEPLTDLAAELVGRKVDVLVTESTVATRAAMDTTRTTPIVMAVVGDPVGSGLVASLARPGGNVTGLTNMTPDLVAKRLELLKEAVPSASRIAVLWNPDTPFHRTMITHIEAVAPSLRVRPEFIAVHRTNEFERAFHEMSARRVDALLVLDGALFALDSARLPMLAARARLPAVYGHREHVEAGGLMAYGANLPELFRRAAVYVDKILKGSKPADLPVEQPTKFELVLNLKTAKALGLTIPQSLLLRADEVIR